MPAVGSKSSALLLSVSPPSNSTLPFESTMAACCARGETMLAVRLKVPVVESYNSAADSGELLLSRPPAISTLPLSSGVQLAPWRAWFRAAVAVKVCVAGSNISAVLTVQSVNMMLHGVFRKGQQGARSPQMASIQRRRTQELFT